MILVGEAHPELPLASMIASLGLSAHARHIGFTPIEDFNGYMAACDIVLNLRYPTVGESSGTLLRALGMGKAVVVSDVGSFREYPDEICLKAPVDASEEDHLFEYLNLLVSRPEVARALGARARAWVERECNWESVARRYVDFLEAVVEGRESVGDVEAPAKRRRVRSRSEPSQRRPRAEVPAETSHVHRVLGSGGGRIARLRRDPPDAPRKDAGHHAAGRPGGSRSGDGRVSANHAGAQDPAGLRRGARLLFRHGRRRATSASVTSESGETFECDIDLFDAEKDPFPYPDGYFSTVLCCELLEHLTADPMHMMTEINRILKPGGHLVLTTPNLASLRALAGILQGFHPQLFSAYIRPRNGEVDARHNREYTPIELRKLLEDSGFEVTLLETGPFREEPKPEFGWVEHLLDRYLLSTEHRGDGIYAVGRKIGPVRERYPAWLYS